MIQNIFKSIIVDEKIQKIIPIVLCLFLSIFIFRYTFQEGMFRTHDGEIHIIRSMHFFSEVIRGQIPVRMIPEMAYGHGYLVFQFFYPFPYYLSSLFQIVGFSAVDAWKVLLFLTTFLSFVFYYYWSKKHLTNSASLLATTAFAIVPFRFLTLFVSGQIGAQLSLLFVPIILFGLADLLKNDNNRGVLIVSLGIAGLITSHLLSVIIFFLPMFCYGLYLLLQAPSKNKIYKLLISILLSFGLSAFYLLPFLIEKSWVRLGHEILVNHRDHWPTLSQLVYSPWGHGYSEIGANDGMSFQVGAVVLFSLLLSLLQMILNKRFRNDRLSVLMLVVALFLFFLMTPYASFVWELLYPLKLLQYPWRLLASVTFVASWLVGRNMDFLNKKQFKLIYAVLMIALGFLNVRNYAQPWPLDWFKDQDYQDSFYAYYGPTDISWELMPVTATKILRDKPSLVLNESDESLSVHSAQWLKQGSKRFRVDYTSSKDMNINVILWDLPVWGVEVNGQKASKITAIDGTIEAPVTKGSGYVEFVLKKTMVQKISDGISVISFGLFLVYFYWFRNKQDYNLVK